MLVSFNHFFLLFRVRSFTVETSFVRVRPGELVPPSHSTLCPPYCRNNYPKDRAISKIPGPICFRSRLHSCTLYSVLTVLLII